MKAILTKYLPATTHKGSRVKAFDSDGNSLTVAYDSCFSNYHAHERAANLLCKKMGWTGDLIGGGIKTGYAFVFKN